MGLEYALVHDATREAFDLGKYCGGPWREKTPTSREEVRAYFVGYYVDEDDPLTEPDMVDPATDAVWAFIESHPGCRLVNEHDDVSWRTDWPPAPETVACWGEENCFHEIGSRYDVRPCTTSAKGQP